MSKSKSYKIISMRELSRVSGIGYSKIYANIIGRYEESTLTESEKTRLCNALYDELGDWAKLLDAKIIMKRL
jgi:hypothetical protein